MAAMAEIESLESSLPVPSVQELAIQRPDEVPRRYIRDGDEIATFPFDPTIRVPLIDMAKLINAETKQQELQKLHFACRNWGVFQVLQKFLCFVIR